MSALQAWRRREARRRRYARRRAVVLLIVIALGAACYLGIRSLGAWWRARSPNEATPTAAASAGLPFTPDRFLTGPDLDDDGQAERVAISLPESGKLQVALVTGPSGKERLIGQVISLPDFPLLMTDLPREKQLLIWEGELPRRGEPTTIQVGDEEALVAQGGEPDRLAWRLTLTQGLVPVDYYAAAAPLAPPEPTIIMVDKGLNVLWYFADGRLEQTARVTTGQHIEGPAPSHANRMENRITPVGRFQVSLLSHGMPYYRENIPALDPQNPLGTRWIGFDAYAGDNGTIWAIHGTNEPETIGQWASMGCIRMRNDEVERLYTQVELGTPIVIMDSLAETRP